MLIKVVANILINTLVLTWLHTETFLDGKDLFGLLPEASRKLLRVFEESPSEELSKEVMKE